MVDLIRGQPSVNRQPVNITERAESVSLCISVAGTDLSPAPLSGGLADGSSVEQTGVKQSPARVKGAEGLLTAAQKHQLCASEPCIPQI